MPASQPNSFVHVIDDDEAVRDSLAALLDSAGMEVRTYASAGDFLARGASAEAGCVVTDVRMPEITGLELLRHLNERGARFPVIVLTGEADVPMAVEALKRGASDFIEKPFNDDVILDATRAALLRMEGDAQRSEEAQDAADKIALLSSREREVLTGLVAGRSNKIIALDLGISPRTVEVYRANIMSKTHADSLSDLVKMALLSQASAPA